MRGLEVPNNRMVVVGLQRASLRGLGGKHSFKQRLRLALQSFWWGGLGCLLHFGL